MILKVGVKHLGMEFYKFYINHDPGMTLTYFTARSTQVVHAFEWKKIGKCHVMAGNLLGMSNGQKIYAYENIFGPGVVCPCPGAIYM